MSSSRPVLTTQQAEALQVGHALDMIAMLPPHTYDDALAPEVQVACLESYYSNLRVPVEFLGGQDKKTIRAVDFVPTWVKPAGKKAQQLWREYGFASEQVSHLGKARVHQPGDPYVNVHPEKLRVLALMVFEVFDEFIAELTAGASAFVDQFKLMLEQARRHWMADAARR